ncbi:MAG: PQQ-binding-like beta-propeller repeat protein [Planctomycetes bacterium]|nr:PQQ-binding-like beta-propeller repeat protein [Planctomycetota bacterium]
MKKLIAAKTSAVPVCILMAGLAGLFAQQAEPGNPAGEPGSVGPAKKAASQPVSDPSPEKVAAAQRLLEGLLSDQGITTDREQRITELLKKLGDSSYEVREKATGDLCKEGGEIAPLVEKAAETDDAEVKARCEIILKAVKGKGSTIGADIARAVDVLAQAGRTKVVGMLIDLLAHREASARAAAAQCLMRLTGESFGFKAADDDEKRLKSLEQWKTWWGKNRATFSFKQVIQTGVLFCDLTAKTVTAFSFLGETLWTRTFDDPPSSAIGLPGGNILVAFRAEPGYAVEYDSAGKEVWSTKEFKLDVASICAEASRLPGGNTILAFPHDQKVIVVTPQGKVALQIDGLEHHPHAAQATADGNIMVMEHLGKVFIYDQKGKAVSSFSSEGVGVDAVPLPGGNILVSSLSNPYLQEYDAEGKSVWTRECPAKVGTAIRLGDGNTVLSNGAEGLVIVDQQGEVVKTLVKHNNYQPWTGKVRLMSQLPGKGATTAPAASRPASRPASSGPATAPAQ